MAASDHLQNHQLSMFIPARELMKYPAGDEETINSGYLPMTESPNVHARKLRESKEGQTYKKHTENLYDSIKKEGVKSPVHLRLHSARRGGGIQVWDGQHRYVSAHDIDPNMEVPVMYSVDKTDQGA